jgi:HEAT repeat protein
MLAYRKEVEEELKELRPILLALRDQKKTLTQAVGDEDRAVLLAGAGALENIAKVRAKLRLKAATVPAAVRERGDRLSEDPLLETLRDAVPALAKRLSTEDVRGRLACLYALESMEAVAEPATPALLRALKDDNAFVRWGAVRVLGKLPPPKQEGAVTELAKLLADENGDVRITTAAALERYGPAAKEAVPALIKALKAEDAETRVWSIQALAAVGPEAKGAVGDLIRSLADREAGVRRAAAEALGKFGPVAKDAALALNKAAEDEDGGVRLAANQALLGACKESCVRNEVWVDSSTILPYGDSQNGC